MISHSSDYENYDCSFLYPWLTLYKLWQRQFVPRVASLTHFAVLTEESVAFPISNLKRSPRPFELPAVRAMQSKVGRFHQLCEGSKGARQSLWRLPFDISHFSNLMSLLLALAIFDFY